MEAHVFEGGALGGDPIPLTDLHDTLANLGDGAWIWVDAVDPSVGEVTELQGQLGLHELAIEDVQHRDQRPKLELYPGHAFAVFRPISLGPDGLEECELFVFISDRFFLTLRYSPAFDLDRAKQRWPAVATLAPGTAGALYVVADEIVDGYLEVVEHVEDLADELEGEVFRSEPSAGEEGQAIQVEILRLRRDTVRIRRHAVPMRQAIDRLTDDLDLVTERLVPYFRDVTDHLLRAIELTDGVREILTTIVDIRMAQSANRLNEVMKKLTAWAGIILVPTLIAGIYGMNFGHMPELRWFLGYPLALGLMAVSALALYLGFRKRGWL